jgi:CheY-like chemotaxis protein
VKKPLSSVLYIDDSESNLFLVELIMEDAGLLLSTAATGEEGIEKILTIGYDLIFTDIHLPNADGYAVLNNARQKESLNEFTPVIAFTANVTVESKAAIMDAGFTDFIGKPFKPADLNLLLNVFLDNEHFTPPNFSYYSDILKKEEEKVRLKRLLQNDFQSFEKECNKALRARDWICLLDAFHKIEFNCSNLKLDSFLQFFEYIRAEGEFTPKVNAEIKRIKRNLLKLYHYFK